MPPLPYTNLQLHGKGNGIKHRSSQRPQRGQKPACPCLQHIYFALLVAKCGPMPLVCLVSQPGLHSYLQSISKNLTFEEETLNIAPFHLREESYWVSYIRSIHPFSSKVYKHLTGNWLCRTTVSFLEELSWIPVLGTSWLPSLCNHMLATWAAEQQQNSGRDPHFILTSDTSFSRITVEIQSFPVSLQLLLPEKGSIWYT